MFAYTDPRQALGDIQTPPYVAEFLHGILKHLKPDVVLDPSCGIGNLLRPWSRDCTTIGVEKNPELWKQAQEPEEDRPVRWGLCEQFEHMQLINFGPYIPQLVMCNPPWNRHWKNLNYPEIFLRKIVELFGSDIPICLLCPMGFRLNQEVRSARAKWLRSSDAPQITSMIACPRNLYPDTQFHSEIILFNVKRVKPHYWMIDPPEKL